MLIRAMIVAKTAAMRKRLRGLLGESDVLAASVSGKSLLWERAVRKACDLIVAEQAAIPHPLLDNLSLVTQLPDPPAVVVIVDEQDPDLQAGLMACGCDAVLHRRVSDDRLAEALAAVCEKRRAATEGGIASTQALDRPQLSDFISRSAAMQAFLRVVRRVVNSDTSLLLLGETGVGKERLARAIHAEGPRMNGPFVAVNCGALPESLLESELFGHEEGSFTGATRSRRGCFELAHGGTIFLDEIAEMPGHLQVKLLRVLQDHEVQRVGGEKPFFVDVRVMAASNRDLEEEVDARRFRRDLYYRLGVVTLTVPPLRERTEDIPELTQSYIGYLRPRVGRDVNGIADDAVDALMRYAWPGNVRELINVVERAMLLADHGEITRDDLPAVIGRRLDAAAEGGAALPRTADDVPAEWLDRPLKDLRGEVVQQVERAYLAALLRQTNGRVGETARRAGIQPRSLFEKMKRYRLRKEDFRPKRPGR